MDKLIVLVALLGALFGCNGGRDEVVHRVVVSGKDVLLSRASMQDGVLRMDHAAPAFDVRDFVLGEAERDPERRREIDVAGLDIPVVDILGDRLQREGIAFRDQRLIIGRQAAARRCILRNRLAAG